jgi:4-carboxymuconolactone decarboxylase
VYEYGNLDEEMRELITITVLTTNHTLSLLKQHVEAAIRIGCDSSKIKETVYQCTLYIGFPRTLNALSLLNTLTTVD